MRTRRRGRSVWPQLACASLPPPPPPPPLLPFSCRRVLQRIRKPTFAPLRPCALCFSAHRRRTPAATTIKRSGGGPRCSATAATGPCEPRFRRPPAACLRERHWRRTTAAVVVFWRTLAEPRPPTAVLLCRRLTRAMPRPLPAGRSPGARRRSPAASQAVEAGTRLSRRTTPTTAGGGAAPSRRRRPRRPQGRRPRSRR